MSLPVVVGHEVVANRCYTTTGNDNNKYRRRSRRDRVRRQLPPRWVEKEIETHRFRLHSPTASSSYDSCDGGDNGGNMTVISASMPVIPPPLQNVHDNTDESNSCASLAAVLEEVSEHNTDNKGENKRRTRNNPSKKKTKNARSKKTKRNTSKTDEHAMTNMSDGSSRKRRDKALGCAAVGVIFLYGGYVFLRNQMDAKTASPTVSPAPSISLEPSVEPSWMPSISIQPSSYPSISSHPSMTPSAMPTLSAVPSSMPSVEPSYMPSLKPSWSPTKSMEPSWNPTPLASSAPTLFPTTLSPSISPGRGYTTSITNGAVSNASNHNVFRGHRGCRWSEYLWAYTTVAVTIFFCFT